MNEVAPDPIRSGHTPRRQLSSAVRANFTSTIISSVRTIGSTVTLGIDAISLGFADVVRLKFQWRETLAQSWMLITVTVIPAILMAVPFGVVVAIQIGNLIKQLAAETLLGAAGGFAIIDQGAPIATGLLLGGACGSAIAADLGARTIREEIDAMQTLGINPINRLVVPRVAAMIIVAPLLNIIIIFAGTGAGFLVAISTQGVATGTYWATFGSFTSVDHLYVSLLKSMFFGFLVAVIACHRGLTTKGGPRGVADNVNAAVVLSVLATTVLNLVVTQLVTMFLPTRLA